MANREKGQFNGNSANSAVNDDDLTAAAALSQEGSVVILTTSATGTTDIRCSNAALENSALPKDSMRFYHDSGANRHIAFEHGLFHNYARIEPIAVNGFNNTLHSSAIGKGDVHFLTNYNGVSRTVKLKDVLHARLHA